MSFVVPSPLSVSLFTLQTLALEEKRDSAMLNAASARDAVRSAWRVFILRCAVADPGEGLHPQLACRELPGRGGVLEPPGCNALQAPGLLRSSRDSRPQPRHCFRIRWEGQHLQLVKFCPY